MPIFNRTEGSIMMDQLHVFDLRSILDVLLRLRLVQSCFDSRPGSQGSRFI